MALKQSGVESWEEEREQLRCWGVGAAGGSLREIETTGHLLGYSAICFPICLWKSLLHQ